MTTDDLWIAGVLRPELYTNPTGTYDLGVAMSAATCIHPSHREFGVTSGRPRVVGFFDCVAQVRDGSLDGSLDCFLNCSLTSSASLIASPRLPAWLP